MSDDVIDLDFTEYFIIVQKNKPTKTQNMQGFHVGDIFKVVGKFSFIYNNQPYYNIYKYHGGDILDDDSFDDDPIEMTNNQFCKSFGNEAHTRLEEYDPNYYDSDGNYNRELFNAFCLNRDRVRHVKSAFFHVKQLSIQELLNMSKEFSN